MCKNQLKTKQIELYCISEIFNWNYMDTARFVLEKNP